MSSNIADMQTQSRHDGLPFLWTPVSSPRLVKRSPIPGGQSSKMRSQEHHYVYPEDLHLNQQSSPENSILPAAEPAAEPDDIARQVRQDHENFEQNHFDEMRRLRREEERDQARQNEEEEQQQQQDRDRILREQQMQRDDRTTRAQDLEQVKVWKAQIRDLGQIQGIARELRAFRRGRGEIRDRAGAIRSSYTAHEDEDDANYADFRQERLYNEMMERQERENSQVNDFIERFRLGRVRDWPELRTQEFQGYKQRYDRHAQALRESLEEEDLALRRYHSDEDDLNAIRSRITHEGKQAWRELRYVQEMYRDLVVRCEQYKEDMRQEDIRRSRQGDIRNPNTASASPSMAHLHSDEQ